VNLDEFLDKLERVHRGPSSVTARCPAHDDRNPSLSISEGENGRLLVKCHATCETEDVLKAMGLTFADISGEPYIETRYEYRDELSTLRYTVERWNPKTFRCRPKLPPEDQRILFNLPMLAYHRAQALAQKQVLVVYVVEGEKDVLTLWEHGIIATCNVTGAGAWLKHYSKCFDDCHVKVVADNDPVGRSHARDVYASIMEYGRAAKVELFVPPESKGKDVTEMYLAGYTVDDLVSLDPVPSLLTKASTVQTRKVGWLWDGYIAVRKLTLLEGDPGDGKSVLTVDLAARLSTGAPMPDGSRNRFGPINVVMVSGEDDMDDTTVPRLEAAGADLNRIHLIDSGFDLSRLSDVADAARRVRAQAIVFDPFSAFLEEKTDSNIDASVRRALGPLRDLARDLGTANIAVRHLNKGGSGTKVVYRGNGSIGFTGAARAEFLVAPDPERDDVKVFACVKMNLAPKPASLAYVVEQNANGVPYVRWLKGTSFRTAQSLVDGPERISRDEPEQATKRRTRDLAIAFLKTLLEGKEPMSWTDIVEAGRADGHTEHTLRNARADAFLQALPAGKGGNSTLWTWPKKSTTDSTQGAANVPTFRPREGVGLEPPNTWQDGKLTGEANSASLGVDLFGDGQPSHVSGTYADPTLTDAERDALLDAAELICDVCRDVDDGVTRYGKPDWAIRCLSHSPYTYAGGTP